MNTIRPTTLADFHGQPQLSHDLNILIQAAIARKQCTEHILLSGSPGLGKTTIAQIIANELGLPFESTSAPAIQKPGDLLALLTSLSTTSVVFIDEIHALDRKAEEMLYTAMEDGHVDMILGEGVSARALRIQLQPFTLIGATTQTGELSSPLRDRFGYMGRLVPYSQIDLAGIVMRSSSILGVTLDLDASILIASRSRGTPRVANRWLKRIRDWAQVNKEERITAQVAKQALDDFGIDKLGLDDLAREILETMVKNFNGGPVGLGTLAMAVGEAEITIEQAYEPHLISMGLLMRTPRGRVVTTKGYAHIGLKDKRPKV
jgi:Holliday junction DNA helicase RuvB